MDIGKQLQMNVEEGEGGQVRSLSQARFFPGSDQSGGEHDKISGLRIGGIVFGRRRREIAGEEICFLF